MATKTGIPCLFLSLAVTLIEFFCGESYKYESSWNHLFTRISTSSGIMDTSDNLKTKLNLNDAINARRSKQTIQPKISRSCS
ncbi:hypothetical protein PVAP13_2KG586801 [Panicum virgatum]|uniref:Secreted protein n=1 Tax=Panicum virgatum TaxID=38727 RepID=A0A8T0WWN1_PANVG|nr:hypothetical protein PVAP13_2KG586801 [Panicum virgatum]